MSRPFKTSNPLHPGRSAFDLSYSKLFTCDMGQLIPIMCEEVVPGDKFKIGNEVVVRLQPMFAPVLHEINLYAHYFFIPNRILWPEPNGWQSFITGGKLGQDSSVLPRWPEIGNEGAEANYHDIGTLWDYLGMPILTAGHNPTGSMPVDFPRRAYYMIWNEYYRDETLQDELDITDSDNFAIMNRAWEKDYFTSALPWQQRGTAPALPIAGFANAEFNPLMFELGSGGHSGVEISEASGTTIMYANSANGVTNLQTLFNNNQIDLSDATTFNIADLRLAFQVQRWLERNARSGVRYTEFLHAHFGVSPRDDRLQRPEYIGGSKSPVIISEVLQTSEKNNTPLGTMAGHGISASSEFCGSYFATEYGWIMGIMSIVPKPMYQEGINRQFLRRSKYDYFFPEFANLSEQAIEKAEIFATDNETWNKGTFGFQGRYDEMRYKPNLVCGLMRTDFAFWHLGRIFDPEDPPALGEDFIKCVPDKRIFATENQPGLIVSFGNIIKAIRPLPISSEPGLIDHH